MTAPPSPTPDPAPETLARWILRRADRATLATTRNDGWPSPSLIFAACDHDGSTILLVSTLAEHTRNLLRDDRCGLLFDGTGGLDEPANGPRLTLYGQARKTDEPRHRLRYLARHPGAARYEGFRDFSFYRLSIMKAHLVAGFGRAHWLQPEALAPDATTLAGWADPSAEIDTVARINQHHGNLVALVAAKHRQTGEPWIVTGLDPDGCDLRQGNTVIRCTFDQPVGSAEAAIAALQRLAGLTKDDNHVSQDHP